MKSYIFRQILPLLIVALTAGKLYPAAKACITVAEPSQKKTVWICKGTWINLNGNNCGTPDSYDEYSWVNLSNTMLTSSAQTFSTSDSGYWELTLSNPFLGYIEKDTFHVVYHQTPQNFSINNNIGITPKCSYDNINLALTGLTPRTKNYKWYVETDLATPIGTGTSITIKLKDIPYSFGAFYYGTAQYDSTYVLGNFTCTISAEVLGVALRTPEVKLPADIEVCEGVSMKIAGNIEIVRGITRTAPTNFDFSETSFRWYKNNGAPGPYLRGGPAPTGQGGDTLLSDPAIGTYTYVLEALNNSNCLTRDTIKVTVHPKPVVDIGAPQTICYNTQATLSPTVTAATGTMSYAWTPDASLNSNTIQNPIASPLSTTTYSLLVTSPKGCKGSGTKTIIVNPQLSVSTSFQDSTLCPTDSIQLQAIPNGGTGPFTYLWTPNTAMARENTATPKVSPDAPTNYQVTVTDFNNCKANASLNIDILTLALGGSDPMGGTIKDTIKLEAFNPTQLGFSYKWTDSTNAVISTANIYKAVATNKYTVTVYNPATMCSVSESKTVIFSEESISKVYIPNAFSPSMTEADNRSLKVFGLNVSDQNFIFQVFDNWGALVYQTSIFAEANQNGWNGSLNNSGEPLMNGVYTYTVRGEFLNGSKFEQTGTASLFK